MTSKQKYDIVLPWKEKFVSPLRGNTFMRGFIMYDVKIILADRSVWCMYGFDSVEEAIHDVLVGIYDNPDDLIDSVEIWRFHNG